MLLKLTPPRPSPPSLSLLALLPPPVAPPPPPPAPRRPATRMQHPFMAGRTLRSEGLSTAWDSKRSAAAAQAQARARASAPAPAARPEPGDAAATPRPLVRDVRSFLIGAAFAWAALGLAFGAAALLLPAPRRLPLPWDAPPWEQAGAAAAAAGAAADAAAAPPCPACPAPPPASCAPCPACPPSEALAEQAPCACDCACEAPSPLAFTAGACDRSGEPALGNCYDVGFAAGAEDALASAAPCPPAAACEEAPACDCGAVEGEGASFEASVSRGLSLLARRQPLSAAQVLSESLGLRALEELPSGALRALPPSAILGAGIAGGSDAFADADANPLRWLWGCAALSRALHVGGSPEAAGAVLLRCLERSAPVLGLLGDTEDAAASAAALETLHILLSEAARRPTCAWDARGACSARPAACWTGSSRPARPRRRSSCAPSRRRTSAAATTTRRSTACSASRRRSSCRGTASCSAPRSPTRGRTRRTAPARSSSRPRGRCPPTWAPPCTARRCSSAPTAASAAAAAAARRRRRTRRRRCSAALRAPRRSPSPRGCCSASAPATRRRRSARRASRRARRSRSRRRSCGSCCSWRRRTSAPRGRWRWRRPPPARRTRPPSACSRPRSPGSATTGASSRRSGGRTRSSGRRAAPRGTRPRRASGRRATCRPGSSPCSTRGRPRRRARRCA